MDKLQKNYLIKTRFSVLLFTKILLGVVLAEKAFFIGLFFGLPAQKTQHPTNKSPSLKKRLLGSGLFSPV
jgi:hypothetical protein